MWLLHNVCATLPWRGPTDIPREQTYLGNRHTTGTGIPRKRKSELRSFPLMKHSMLLALLVSSLLSGCGQATSPVERISVSPERTGLLDELPPVEQTADNWPWWRGPTFDGKAPEDQTPPTTWSETKNLVWKTQLPGRGHGSPSIWENRIFLATADEETEIQSMLCYDRTTGDKLWQKEIHRGGFMHMHPKNSHASATPAVDGERVFIQFMVQGGIWMTAIDFDGEILWQKKVGPFKTVHGFGPSPLLYKSVVIVAGDNPDGSFLTALSRKSGEVVWQTARPNHQSFSCPVVAEVAGREQLLITGPFNVASYDPTTGEELWTCKGPTDVAANTVVWDDEFVYASAGFPQKNLLCIRADGSGDVTETHLVWQQRGKATYVPSLLIHEGLLYMVNDVGLVQCFESKTGEVVWREKLRGGFSSSPTLAGGNIYVVNEAGRAFVFKPGRQFELVAENELDTNGGFATPVFLDSRIYLRAPDSLYCLGDAGHAGP